jgi:multiple sugar transport system substrate-binding protein
VALKSKETIDSIRFMVDFWRDAYDEGGLAWDDTNNNRAFLSGTCSCTNNGASIYIEAKRKPQTYLTEKGTPMRDDIGHAPLPKGPEGQFIMPGWFSNMVMSYSKNQKAAKEFLRWVGSTDIYEKWFVSQRGYTVGATRHWENHKFWESDPVILPFRAAARSGRLMGYAGPADRKAAEVLTKQILTDMYAQAVQGMSPEQAVKGAHEEVAKIYAS